MSRLENVEAEIQRMSPSELAEFRAWFASFEADAWDTQFEADAESGKLDSLAAAALREHEAGRSTKL